MKLSSLIIGIVIFSASAIGITAFYGDMLGNYNQTTTNVSYLDKSAAISANITAMETAMLSDGVSSISILEIPYMVARGAFNAIKILFQSMNIFASLVSDLSILLNLPSWFISMILLILSITIVFGLLSAILKKEV